MLRILPFKGIIYNKEKVGDVSKVVAPPYDVISPSEQNFYYKLHPYNIIRIILGKEKKGDNLKENKYTRAAQFFHNWVYQGVLIKEKLPSIYLYHQRYRVDDRVVERKGFISLMKLEDFRSGVVFPHEQVFPEPQEDRLNLLRTCSANFSAVFSLFSDPERKIDSLCMEEETIFEFEDSAGVKHRLSAIRDKKVIEEICFCMQKKKVFIADGHHRYLTALRFREEVKKSSYSLPGADYIMMYFLNMDSGGVTILPVHRLIGGLDLVQTEEFVKEMEKFFYKKPFREYEDEEITGKRLLSQLERGECLFGIYTKNGGYYLLFPKKPQIFSKKIKSAILDDILKGLLKRGELRKGEDIYFTTSSFEAVDKVKKGIFQVAFFLAPTKIEEVRDVALSGGKMPPKSTYFYPKLLSGILIRELKDAF